MSTIKAANVQNTGSGAPTFKNSSGTEIGQLCKAWVKFDGTGTVTINNDFGVDSITDHGTGAYQVNFTNSFSSTHYSVGGFCHRNGQGRVINHIDLQHADTNSSRYRFNLSGTNNAQNVGLSNVDVDIVYLQFFHD